MLKWAKRLTVITPRVIANNRIESAPYGKRASKPIIQMNRLGRAFLHLAQAKPER